MKTRNCRYLDRLGWTGTHLENREHFYFPDASQISAMVGNHFRQMKTQICTVGDIGIHQRWISLITNPLNCCALVPPSQINRASLENVGQASSEYPINRQNLGWLAKSKIPDRLGSSRHYENQALILPTWRYLLFPCKKLDSSGVLYTIQLIKLILF